MLLLYQSCSLVFSTAIPKHHLVTSKALSEYGREKHFDKKIQLKPSNNHFRNHKKLGWYARNVIFASDINYSLKNKEEALDIR